MEHRVDQVRFEVAAADVGLVRRAQDRLSAYAALRMPDLFTTQMAGIVQTIDRIEVDIGAVPLDQLEEAVDAGLHRALADRLTSRGMVWPTTDADVGTVGDLNTRLRQIPQSGPAADAGPNLFEYRGKGARQTQCARLSRQLATVSGRRAVAQVLAQNFAGRRLDAYLVQLELPPIDAEEHNFRAALNPDQPSETMAWALAVLLRRLDGSNRGFIPAFQRAFAACDVSGVEGRRAVAKAASSDSAFTGKHSFEGQVQQALVGGGASGPSLFVDTFVQRHLAQNQVRLIIALRARGQPEQTARALVDQVRPATLTAVLAALWGADWQMIVRHDAVADGRTALAALRIGLESDVTRRTWDHVARLLTIWTENKPTQGPPDLTSTSRSPAERAQQVHPPAPFDSSMAYPGLGEKADEVRLSTSKTGLSRDRSKKGEPIVGDKGNVENEGGLPTMTPTPLVLRPGANFADSHNERADGPDTYRGAEVRSADPTSPSRLRGWPAAVGRLFDELTYGAPNGRLARTIARGVDALEQMPRSHQTAALRTGLRHAWLRRRIAAGLTPALTVRLMSTLGLRAEVTCLFEDAVHLGQTNVAASWLAPGLSHVVIDRLAEGARPEDLTALGLLRQIIGRRARLGERIGPTQLIKSLGPAVRPASSLGRTLRAFAAFNETMPAVRQEATAPLPNADTQGVVRAAAASPSDQTAWDTQIAGVVLLWPFLARFFDALDLSDAGRFASPRAQARAVALVHHLATGHDTDVHVAVALPNHLCGLPPDAPLPRQAPITSAERDLTAEVLVAVCDRLRPRLDLSVTALRGNYLIRAGHLVVGADASTPTKLTVRHQPYDTFLGALDWPMGVVRLPNMTQALFVDWLRT